MSAPHRLPGSVCPRAPGLLLAVALALPAIPAPAGAQVHYTYLWHLEQPVYWPAPDGSGVRYQRAWESMQSKAGGAAHPQNDLDQIFGLDDRVAAYQWRPKDSLATLLGHDEAGVQVSYSGGLIENVQSLGDHAWGGYSGSWNGSFKTAQGWKTRQGGPRMDMVVFPFHHPLMPLVDDRVNRMEIALWKQVAGEAWDASVTSKGLFPPEMAFSERLIPLLVEAGIEWVVVSNAHISRACADYPWVAGSGGDNIPPPNRADALNPAQGTYNRISIDRGVSPANAYPLAYRPHYARYVKPASGVVSRIVVVPAAMGESWKDGYSCYGLDEASAYASSGSAQHPILVLMAHDGDNAFGGGYSYYMECVPGLAGAASGKGLVPTTVAGYLKDHPVEATDTVHVEDGAWVNADGDFGSPSFWNWNWPPVSASGQVDVANGWAEDERGFAFLTAATNWVLTAEDAKGPANVAKILHPDAGGVLEQAWHFLLGGLNSGYMYYGKALDMELKPVVAANEAIQRARQSLGATYTDKTPPTVWAPQHYPDNPGGTNFGPLYRYQVTEMGPETWFWTFVADVSGVASVTLKYRVDADGTNSTANDQNETYAGGADVGGWQSLAMARREFPKGNPYNDPEIDTSVLPDEIADEYWVRLTGVRDALLDWYVEAQDAKGHVTRTAIRHLYIGASQGTTTGKWTPADPTACTPVTVTDKTGGFLHWGVNGWNLPPEAIRPAGSTPWTDGKAVETPFAACEAGFCVTIPAVGEGITSIDFVVHHADGSWDNNGGQDWHVPIAACGTGDPGGGEDVAAAEDVAGGEDAMGADAVATDEGEDRGAVQDPGAGEDPGNGSDEGPDTDPGTVIDPGTDADPGATDPGGRDTAPPDATPTDLRDGDPTAGKDVDAGNGGRSGGGCSAGAGTVPGAWAWLALLGLAAMRRDGRRRG